MKLNVSRSYGLMAPDMHCPQSCRVNIAHAFSPSYVTEAFSPWIASKYHYLYLFFEALVL